MLIPLVLILECWLSVSSGMKRRQRSDKRPSGISCVWFLGVILSLQSSILTDIALKEAFGVF